MHSWSKGIGSKPDPVPPGGLVNHRASEQPENPTENRERIYTPVTKEHRSLLANPGKVDSARLAQREDRNVGQHLRHSQPLSQRSSCCRDSVLLKFSDLSSEAIALSKGQSLLSLERGWGGQGRVAEAAGTGLFSPAGASLAGLSSPGGSRLFHLR